MPDRKYAFFWVCSGILKRENPNLGSTTRLEISGDRTCRFSAEATGS